MFDTWKLKKRIDSMENTLQRLSDGFQQLELEWINAYAKFKKIAGRINKEAAMLESRHSGDDNPDPSSTSQIGPNGPGLSPHQKEVQQRILKRRAGLVQ